MQEWIAENLAKGFIRNSSFPYGRLLFDLQEKFTTLDLRGAYNLLRIKEGDEPKRLYTNMDNSNFCNAFRFGKRSSQFQRMMNSLFRHMIASLCSYLDDIVVYSDNLEIIRNMFDKYCNLKE
ncbi:hypothetical protein BASA83_013778 [Batrachochytrium salamandrivorans]|nr:hypothetical protein BASA83_013778 [Batrachochytrium salamandrivorans]